MATFCLLPQAVEKFKSAIKTGEIYPEKLAEMTSAERHELFGNIVGKDNAESVNGLFESKLLLKNQQAGMINWAKRVAKINPEVRRDLISKIERLDHVLDPQESKQFLNDLANTRLGYGVTQAEAKHIAELSKNVSNTRAAITDYMPDGTKERFKYGEAVHELNEYTGQLKNPSHSFKETLQHPGPVSKGIVNDFAHHPSKLIESPLGLTKSLKATLDLSALGRQGWKEMWNNPTLWAKNAVKQFKDVGRGLANKDVNKAINADVFSRKNFLNNRYKKMGLDVNTVEEAYPSQLPEKIPLLGRLYKASEGSYTGFTHRLRADMADKYLELAKKQGQNVDNPEFLKGLGKFVNSMTGRGNLGKGEPAANIFNVAFFSPRALKSNLDILKLGQQANMSSFVRKRAALSALKVIVGTAGVLGTAAAMIPGSVEFDPRSADFGKIKIGNTRFDVTAGMGSILTLAARLAKFSSKSSTTGIVSPLGNKFGQTSGWNVVQDYFDNKASPGAAFLKDLVNRQDRNGKKLSAGGELNNLFTPLPVSNVQELSSDKDSANVLLSSMADALGVSTNTYGKSTTDWSQSPGKELSQFQKKVGDSKFKTANQQYNTNLDNWMKSNRKEIDKLPNDQKQSKVTKEKADLKKGIFSQYGFKYKKAMK